MIRRRAAGRLRQRIYLENRREVEDGYGGQLVEWVEDPLRILAEVKAPSGMSAARALLSGPAATYRSLWSIRMDARVGNARVADPATVRIRVKGQPAGPVLLLRPLGPPGWDSEDPTMVTVLCEAYTHEA